MKKFMKGCAIVALIMIVFGLVLAVVAGTRRGSAAITEVVERVTGRRIHVNFSIGSLPFGIWFGDDDRNYELDTSGIYDTEHDVLQVQQGALATISIDPDAVIKELDIDLGGCSFETRISGTGEFYVEANGMEKIQAYEERDVLYIRSMNTHIKLAANFGKVVLYVPEGQYYDRVDIELGAGEMTFDELDAKEISLEVGAGAILCKSITAEKLEASVGMGQIELREMDVDELDAEIGMGELLGTGIINKGADLECSMGNLDLKLDGSEKDYNYKLEAAAGNIDIDRDSFSGLATSRWIDNNAAKTLNIECSMGNISIRFTK